MTAIEQPESTPLDPRLYVDPDGLAARAGGDLRPHAGSSPATSPTCRAPGRFVTVQVGGESALVVRGEDGELRAFRNVCRHRAARLREGRGDCGKALRCPYHGWTYRTDGQLIGVPEGRGFAGLDKAQLGLMPARVETFAGLVFVNLDLDAAPLADGLAGLGAAARAVRARAPHALQRVDVQPAGQLEDRRRQLPRGLPRPDRPPEPDAAARLPALHGRGGRGLRVVRGAAAREAVGQPARARVPADGAADAGSRRGRPQRLALRLPLAEHDDRPLPRPGHDLADQPAGDRGDPRRLGVLPGSEARARRCAPCSGSTTASTSRSPTRTPTSSPASRPAWRRPAGTPGPLGEREAAVAWFADHVRRALEATG